MSPELPHTIDIEALARHIAMRMDPEALMDADDVGAYFKCSARYVLEEYVKAPGFPKAIRLAGPDGRRGNARWRRRDITGWVNDQAGEARSTKRGGRPRKEAAL